MFGERIKTIALLALLLVVPALASAVTVGPLDGKAAPSLRPLGVPAASMSVEVLPGSADIGFPKELEKMGDLRGAATEWMRIAYQETGPQHELALTNATRLYIAMGQPDVAVSLLADLLTKNPASTYAPEALYHIATGPLSDSQTHALNDLREKFNGNPWATAALLHDVWQQAEKGKIKETYGLNQAEELKTRIKDLRRAQQERIAKAGAFGVILPGAGHAYAGNLGQGATVMIIFCLFTLAFLSACRHRHYAYSFLFIIPAVSLWLTSPVVAMQLVRDSTQKKLETSLNSWNDLRPVTPEPGQKEMPKAASKPAAITVPVTVSATEEALPPLTTPSPTLVSATVLQ